MDTLLLLLDNSALMGIIGLILGGVFALVSGLIQSACNNRHIEKMRHLEMDQKHKTELREKKERTYLKFLDFRGVFLMLQTIQNDTSAQDGARQGIASLLAEKYREVLVESSALFAELELYGAPEIAKKCSEFSYKYALYTNEQFGDFSRELGEIVEHMRNDLASIN